MNIRKLIAGASAALLLTGGLALATALPASATPAECVPSDAVAAYTEVVPDIAHPAEYETVIVTPAVAAATKWWNFAPNEKGPFEGTPVFPEDVNGVWVGPHTEGGPGQDQSGVYQQGEGNGSWFYRENTAAQEAVTEQKLVKEAWTEVVPDIEHAAVPAVVCEEEPPAVINECATGTDTHSTNLNELWANVDTRSAGHYEYVEDGLHVWTDDNSSNAKVSLGQGISFPLHDTGTIGLDWTGSTPPPGVNLFITSELGNGTLVYESVYGQDLWLTNGSSAGLKAAAPVNGGGNGSQWHGTVDQWLSVIPGAQVVGVAFSLGSGVLGDGVIHSITVGCGTHTFAFAEEPVVEEPPVEEPPVVVPPVVQPPAVQPAAVVPLAASEPVSETLAETGGTTSPLPWVAGALAVLLGAALVALNLVRGRRSEG